MSTEITTKFFNETEKTIWNEFIDNSHWGDLLQFFEWGEAKKSEGWDPVRLAVMQDGRILVAAQVLIKQANVLGNYLYIPHGPVFQSVSDLKLGIKMFKEGLLELAREREGFSIEIEPKIGYVPEDSLDTPIISKNLQYLIDPAVFKLLERAGFQVTGRNMQPVYKLYYDLEADAESLLGLMKKNTRYNVKLAAKKGVQIAEVLFTDPVIHKYIDEFYDMLLITQERAKGYPIRSREYFHKLVDDFAPTGRMSMFRASFEGQLISVNISERTKFWSSSFYAASNRLFPDVKAPYLMRWQSILRAQAEGCKVYDFWGIIPNSGQHKGYSDNKMSFGGIRVNTYGLLALPLSPSRYFIWNKVLPWRSRLQKLLHR